MIKSTWISLSLFSHSSLHSLSCAFFFLIYIICSSQYHEDKQAQIDIIARQELILKRMEERGIKKDFLVDCALFLVCLGVYVQFY